MLKKLICLIFAVMLIAVTANAKPSKPILKMLNTPVTAFDFFLFELEESCKCDKWFGNPNWKSDPCMTVLNYNIEDDLILLNFYIYDPSRSTTYMKGFINSNARQKEQILRDALERLAIVIGVAERPGKGKPYGLIFDDISGGFTMTGRRGPQAFKVLPLYVYRVYADGRPDEVVRGVDIVGTPLTCFSKILITGDDDDVFQGTCGAESGMIPVSAVSPSVLVSEIEVEKRQKGQEKPPILPPPKHDSKTGGSM